MISTKPIKSQYSEAEIAGALGVSIDEFRSLVKNSVVVQEEDLNNVPQATYNPGDLVMFRYLVQQRRSVA